MRSWKRLKYCWILKVIFQDVFFVGSSGWILSVNEYWSQNAKGIFELIRLAWISCSLQFLTLLVSILITCMLIQPGFQFWTSTIMAFHIGNLMEPYKICFFSSQLLNICATEVETGARCSMRPLQFLPCIFQRKMYPVRRLLAKRDQRPLI